MRAKVRVLICLLLVFSVLYGCDNNKNSDNDTNSNNEYFIYYTNDDYTRIHQQKYKVSGVETMDIINELINELRNGNFKESKTATLPQGIVTININSGILILDFDENYNELSGFEEVLRRAAIVKTLCQIPDITFVQFSVNGQALVVNGNTVGNMTAESFVNNIGHSSDYATNNEINVYYSNAYGTKLKKTTVKVDNNGTESLERIAIERLLKDPDKIGYYSVFNPGVEINRVVTDDKVCYIDFSEEFIDRKGGVSEEVAVYSVVNTLTDLSTVNQVFITVNGEECEYYEDSVEMNVLLERNFEINEERE